MTTSTIFTEFNDLSSTLHNRAVAEWKRQGKKVVGFMCSFVPEEILYTGDILPYRIRPIGCQGTSAADAYMSHINCSLSRCHLQYILDGKYDFLDGLVVVRSCDHVRRLHDILKMTNSTAFPFLEIMNVPRTVSDESIGMYRTELETLCQKVESHFGAKITETGLREAIDLHNETRRLLRELYALRQRENPPLTGTECLSVVLASAMMPKDQYNELLKGLLEELRQREGVSEYRARLMVSGSGGCDNPEYFQMMENLGALVVTDTLCLGSRYFWEPAQVEDDLLLSLAKYYLNRPSCALSVQKVGERSKFMTEMAKAFNVDGIIYQRMKYCDLWGGQLLNIRKKLNEADIPFLDLEREYTSGSSAQLETRVQAFLEMIER
jgi:bzd-type benzoyl-CoA reductase N subunit